MSVSEMFGKEVGGGPVATVRLSDPCEPGVPGGHQMLKARAKRRASSRKKS